MPYGSSSRSTEPSISAASRDHGRRRRSGTPTSDVRGAPDDRDDRERGEDGGGQAGGELTAAAAVRGGDQRDRADAERQRRHADERRSAIPRR